jgi:hypothetical protein
MDVVRKPPSPGPESPIPPPPEPRATPAPDATGSFHHVLHRLATEVDRGERVVRTALRGNPYDDDTRGMIALQAGVYRYVEAVELCTKLVDRSTAAVKTTLQSQ